MQERMTTRTVVFERPFRLAAVDALLPAGSYTVDTDEEIIPELSFVAYRRVRTTINLPTAAFHSAGARQVVTIDPEDLASALERDARAAHVL